MVTSKKRPLRKLAIAAIALLLVGALAASLVVVYYSNEVTKSYYAGYDQGQQSGSASAYESGFAEGHKQGLAERAGYYIKDPSYSEMKNFLASDQTNKNTYDINNYNCLDFSKAVCNNAFDEGYRCGFVYIDLSGSFAHAIVCFNTTDRGLIFIEPQDDSEVTLTIGGHYNIESSIQYSKYSDVNGLIIITPYDISASDDIILSYDIIW